MAHLRLDFLLSVRLPQVQFYQQELNCEEIKFFLFFHQIKSSLFV